MTWRHAGLERFARRYWPESFCAACGDCAATGPLGTALLPFPSAAARAVWLGNHQDRTGHTIIATLIDPEVPRWSSLARTG